MAPPERGERTAARGRFQGDAQAVAAPPDRPDGEQKAGFVLEQAQAVRQIDRAERFEPCAGARPVMEAALGQERVAAIDELGPPPLVWRGEIRISGCRAQGDRLHAGASLGRGSVAQGRVQALPIVKHLDILEHRSPRLGARAELGLMDLLCFA